MMLFFLLALLALAAIALLLWTIREPRVWPPALMMLGMMMMPLGASAAALDTFLTAAAPGLLELIGLMIAAIIAWGTKKAREKWGIDIEARHREALQSAILSGARLALAGKLDTAAAIQLVLTHVSASVPDAVIALQPSAEVLENLARAKLQEAAQAATQVVVQGSDGISPKQFAKAMAEHSARYL